MNCAVLDASVAAKWFLSQREPLTREASRLLQEYDRGRLVLVVPDIFWAEIANLFRKAARQARCTETSARYALESLRAKHFRTVSSLDLIDSAVSLALIHERSTYGCIYIALALTSGCEFVTADERLANAVAARLPVKWLGAI